MDSTSGTQPHLWGILCSNSWSVLLGQFRNWTFLEQLFQSTWALFLCHRHVWGWGLKKMYFPLNILIPSTGQDCKERRRNCIILSGTWSSKVTSLYCSMLTLSCNRSVGGTTSRNMSWAVLLECQLKNSPPKLSSLPWGTVRGVPCNNLCWSAW